MKRKPGRPLTDPPSIGKCEWCDCDVYTAGINKNGGYVYSGAELYKQIPHFSRFIICLECFKKLFRHQLIMKRL